MVSFNISGPQPKIIKRKKSECNFGYRSSVFKKDGGEKKEIIIEATLVLKKGDKKFIREVIEKNINYRQERQPLDYPNIGSIFKNIDCKKISAETLNKFKSVVKTDPLPRVPPPDLISETGLKGVSFGGAMISPKHPNFIVNILAATSDDVKNLILLVKKEVYKKFNVNLEEEIEILA